VTLQAARKALQAHADPVKAKTYAGFFKDAAGDRFLGVTTPQLRKLAKEYRHLPFDAIAPLMHSAVQEERSLAHSILRLQFDKGDEKTRAAVYKFYMANRHGIRQWNGVDDSAPYIVGPYLWERDRAVLYKLVKSKSLWDRRIALVTTWHFIRNGQLDDIYALTEQVLADREDLIHKAAGWMLREAGKKDMKRLKSFLKKHHAQMPRTMLRYAIEKFPENERKAALLGVFT